MNKKERESRKKGVKQFQAKKRKWNLEHPEEAEEKRIENKHQSDKRNRARGRRKAKKIKKELARQKKKEEKEAGARTILRKKEKSK